MREERKQPMEDNNNVHALFRLAPAGARRTADPSSCYYQNNKRKGQPFGELRLEQVGKGHVHCYCLPSAVSVPLSSPPAIPLPSFHLQHLATLLLIQYTITPYFYLHISDAC